MPSLSSMTSLTTILLACNQLVLANPLPLAKGTLVPRLEKNYVDCDDNQKKRLGRAFADAATLANHASSINTDSKAWSHYFRTGDGKDDDLTNAKSVWSMVAANNDPTNPPYQFSVRCGKDDTADCKAGTSLAITDARPQDGDTLREMLVCPIFFKDSTKETNNDLSKREFKRPGRNDGDKSWCSPGNNFQWYEVAGHTLLHEMTHLDALGKAAGVEGREEKEGDKVVFKTHGSDDVTGLGNSYPVAARGLATLWQKGQAPKDALKPWQNAESLAGAALEWFMMDMCDKSGNPIEEIPL